MVKLRKGAPLVLHINHIFCTPPSTMALPSEITGSIMSASLHRMKLALRRCKTYQQNYQAKSLQMCFQGGFAFIYLLRASQD